MTFVLIGLRGSGNFSIRKEPTKNERNLALLALFPLPRGPRPARELLWKFRSLGLPPFLFPGLQVGRIRGGGLRVHLVLCPEGLPHLPLDLGLARGGSVSGRLSVARKSASVSSAPSGAGEGEVARSRRTPPARAASLVASSHSSQHAPRRGELGEVSEDRSLARSSRVSCSSERERRRNRRARSRSDSSRDCGRHPRSRSSSRSRSRGRERRRRSSSRSPSSRERSRSSDHSRSRRVRSGSRGDRFRRDRSWSSDRYQSRRQRARSPARREARGHAILHVALVGDHLPLLTGGRTASQT